MLKQIYLVCYLETKGCEEVRVSPQGYYVMRNKGNGKICGVPLPSNGDFLKDETICNICHQLDVELPPSTKDGIKEIMVSLKKDVEAKINGGDL